MINGKYDVITLETILDDFVKSVVTCSICENPETTLFINTKKENLEMACNACGARNIIININHKLSKFIIKTAKKER